MSREVHSVHSNSSLVGRYNSRDSGGRGLEARGKQHSTSWMCRDSRITVL